MGVVKLGDVARESRLKWTKSKQDVPIVGLEHLIPDEIRFDAYDINTDNTFSKRFVKGQVLFGRRRAYQRKAAIAEFDGICSGDITVIQAIEGKMVPELLPFIIQTPVFFDYANRGSAGSLSPRVKWEHLADYEFELPPLEEQKILADKLWAAYRLKEAYKKLLVATDEMVKSQFIEMFGGLCQDTPWSDVVTITNGKAYPEEYQEEGAYPICGSGGIMCYGEKKLCNGNTTILGRKGNINNPIFMESGYWIVDTAFSIDVDKAKLHPKFFYYWCCQYDFTKLNKQGVLPSLARKDLEKVKMAIPQMRDQLKFVSIAEQADKSKFELKQCIEHIDKVIKSLING
ncbi:restriction endonuclease subunit S [Bacteroides caccae]|uniref:restriction endonuclease subunit S n=1 Tax=Bacteroides caccae TaxID=47678 RepID=UPI0034A56615